MKSKCFLLTLAFCFLHGCMATIKTNTDVSLMLRHILVLDISESNPTHAVECFNTYVSALKQSTDIFESQYLSCSKNAANKRRFANENAIEQRTQLEEAVTADCVNRCQNINDSAIAIFNCYETEGATAAKQMNQVSANAVEYRQDLKIQYAAIESEQNKCTDKAERDYVESNYYLDKELQECLSGNFPTLATDTATAAYQYG